MSLPPVVLFIAIWYQLITLKCFVCQKVYVGNKIPKFRQIALPSTYKLNFSKTFQRCKRMVESEKKITQKLTCGSSFLKK